MATLDVSIENYPWIVSIQRGKAHACGGVIIASDIILTAAHCVTDIVTRPQHWHAISVNAGSSNWKTLVQNHSILSIELHPYFHNNDKGVPVVDLALILLSGQLQFNNKVQPACYTTTDGDLKLIENKQILCYVAGWGVTEKAYTSYPLKLAAVEYATCDDFRRHLDNMSPITEDMMCLRGKGPGVDACQGDSGGPVICKLDKTPPFIMDRDRNLDNPFFISLILNYFFNLFSNAAFVNLFVSWKK